MRTKVDDHRLFDTQLNASSDPAGLDASTFTQSLTIAADGWIDDVQTAGAPRTLSEVYWNGGNGSWSNGSDWSNGKVPNANAEANINAGGKYTINVASPSQAYLITMRNLGANVAVSSTLTVAQDLYIGTGSVTVRNGGDINVAASVDNADSGINVGAPSSGSSQAGVLTITGGGKLTCTTTFVFGSIDSGGSGTLNVLDGGSATITGAFTALGAAAGSSGTATVDGAGSIWAVSADVLVVGSAGAGTLSVSNAGNVNAAGGLGIGWGSGGTGTLTINTGGIVTSTNSYQALGSVATSTGIATVQGSGSLWAVSGELFVGNSGAGRLTVSSGGSINVTAGLLIAAGSDGSGFVDVTSGGLLTSAGGCQAGDSSNATGTATVDGTGSTWTVTGELQLGDGGVGSLTVSNSGLVTVNADQLLVGLVSNGAGFLSIQSHGKVTTSGQLTVGYASQSAGSVNIETGGTLMTAGRYDTIASLAGSKGIISVDGSGSLWKSADQLTVANSGSGTLLVSNAASASIAGNLVIGGSSGSTGTLDASTGGLLTCTGNYQALGSQAGATGTATVDGVGSIWTVSGGLWIGDAGKGTLIVSNSAQVTANQALVANQATGIGAATVESEGQLTVVAINVGDTGSGSLSVFSGGIVTSMSLTDYFGRASGSSGYVQVGGIGSLWNDAGQIIVGGSGNGTLLVSNAGSVNAAGGLGIGAYTSGSGTLNITTGGLVTSAGNYQVLGSNTGATGVATVDGSGSSWTLSSALQIGDSGSGSLTISNSGQVTSTALLIGNHSTGIGAVTVESEGGLTLGSLSVAYTGNGSVNIFSGGTLTSAGQYDTIAGGAGGAGYLHVDGSGSLLSDSGQIVVGGGGNGTLSVSSAGSVNAQGGIEIGGYTDGTYGTLSVTSGGIVSSTGTYQAIGASAGATGSATVDGDGSSWTVTGELKVGDSGTGSLTVSDFGLVTVNADQLLVGLSTGGTGSVTIESLGQVIASGQLTLGFAGQSSGSVDIETGGTLITAGPYDTIGSQADSSGSVRVTGAGSVWKSAGAITIGGAGEGTLEVSSGGSVNAAQGIVLGASATGTGSLDVSGGGLLTSTGTYQAIGGGTGTSGTTGTGAHDSSDNAPGSIATVTGSGSNWNILGSLWVGNEGAGTLMIEAGGSASVQDNLLVGVLSGTEGQVDVTGTGTGGASSLTVGGSLSLGAASNGGIGMMLVSAGASVSVGSASVIGAGSMLTLSAGTISFPDVNGLGTLSILADGTLQGHGTLNGVISDLGAITAMGGTLLLASRPYALTGTGDLIADVDSSISLTAGVALTEAISGEGTLSLGGVFNYTMSGPEDITISDLTIAAVSTLAGSGTIASDITSAGIISATGGILTLSGDVASTGTLQAQPGEVLSLTGDDALGGLLLGEGTISLTGSDTIGTARITVSHLTIGSGGSLSGTGSITSALANAGTLQAEPGTLTLLGAVTDTGTLVTETGAVLDLAGGGTISGAVTGAGNLRLDGKTPYTLQTGAMLSVQHFAVDAGVTVSGIGTITGSTANQGTIVASGGKLLVSGAISGGGMLQATSGATIDLTHGGTLTEAISGAGTLELGAAYMLGTKLPTISAIVVDPGATLSGTGKLNTIETDNGTLLATGGTLSLARAVFGAGTLSASAGSTLSLDAASSFSGLVTGAGEVDIAANLSLSGAASLSAANIVLSANLVQASGDSLGILAGKSLTLSAAAGHSVSVQGAGAVRLSNAGSLAATGAGSAKVSEVFVNSGLVTSSAATLSFLGAATNNGSITAASGLTAFSKVLGGSGSAQIGAAGTLSLLAGTSGGQTVDFLAGTGALELTKPSTFLGTISGFGGSDAIDLVKTHETSFGFSNDVLTVSSGGTTVATLNFSGSYTKSNFTLGSDGHGGTTITFV